MSVAAVPLLLFPAVALMIYGGNLGAPFVFDDLRTLVRNSAIREVDFSQLYSFWSSGQLRGTALFSFSLNYAAGGLDPYGYRLTNVFLHVGSALVLLGIVRRTLLREPMAERYAAVAYPLALVIALVWLVHPLQTQSVVYVVQRMESLMGLCYLLALYCFLRGVDSRWSGIWFAAVIALWALAMGSKVVAATAPVMILWYDRVFVARSWRELYQSRRVFYGVLLLGMLICAVRLWPSVFRGPVAAPTASAGIGGITAAWWHYAASQPGVILHYLRLCIWPSGQCLDYQWPLVQSLSEFLLPGLIVFALMAATVWAIFRRPRWGFLGGWFFVILAPTSSFVPIQDLAFEHRMYLSLAAVVVAAIIGGYKLLLSLSAGKVASGVRLTPPWRALAVGVACVAVLTLAIVASARQQVFASHVSLWQDNAAKRPNNPRVHVNLSSALLETGDLQGAYDAADRAIEVYPDVSTAWRNRGCARLALGEVEAAIDDLTRATQLNDENYEAFAHRSIALQRAGRTAEAIEDASTAIKLRPGVASAYHNRGLCYLANQQPELAAEDFEQALKMDPNSLPTRELSGDAWLAAGQFPRAVVRYTEVLAARPSDAGIHSNRGIALLQLGETQAAAKGLTQAIQLGARDAKTLLHRAIANQQLGLFDAAEYDYAVVDRLHSNYPPLYMNRAILHFSRGRYDEAWRDVDRFEDFGGTPAPGFIEQLAKRSARPQ